MERAGAWAALAAAAVLTFSGCKSKSFRYEVETEDPRPIHSVFLIAAPRDKLKHDSTEEIQDLVRRERYDSYPFFAHFLPHEPATWQQVDQRGPIEPKVKGERITVKFPKSFIELNAGAQVAVVVRFQDRTWECRTDDLVLKGSREYVIGTSELVAKR